MQSNNWRTRAAQAREERKITLEALAEKLDMSVPGVQKWMNGSRQPNLEDIFRIAEALNVPSVWLTHGLEPDDVLDGLGDPAHQTLRRLIHAERTGPLPEAIWSIIKSAVDMAQPTKDPAPTPALSVSPRLEALLNAKPKASTSDFTPLPPTVTAPHEPSA